MADRNLSMGHISLKCASEPGLEAISLSSQSHSQIAIYVGLAHTFQQFPRSCPLTRCSAVYHQSYLSVHVIVNKLP